MRNLLLLGLLFIVLTGCSKEVTADEKKAEDHVKSQGYSIISRKGEVNRYVLDQAKLTGNMSVPYRQTWGVQTVEPENYIGNEIIVYGFTVSNHPLEESNNAKTNVYIMLAEGKVIGGYSLPNIEGLGGGVYSVDGKTLEEVTGMTYKEWSENWKKKYGE